MNIDVRAAVAVEAGKPLEVTTVQLEGPKEGEVLVEVKATGICHTNAFTLSGEDPLTDINKGFNLMLSWAESRNGTGGLAVL